MNPSPHAVRSAVRRMFDVGVGTGGPRMPVGHRGKILDVTARVGHIDGVRCLIEERGPGLYLLHGFMPGTWDIDGVETIVDDDGDAQVTTQRWRILPLPGEFSTSNDRIHVIVGMNTPQQADEFFGDRLQMVWRARKPGGKHERDPRQVPSGC